MGAASTLNRDAAEKEYWFVVGIPVGLNSFWGRVVGFEGSSGAF